MNIPDTINSNIVPEGTMFLIPEIKHVCYKNVFTGKWKHTFCSQRISHLSYSTFVNLRAKNENTSRNKVRPTPDFCFTLRLITQHLHPPWLKLWTLQKYLL